MIGRWRQAPVTMALLAAIAGVFVIETLAGGSTDGAVLARLGANVPPLVRAGEWWRLLTALFLHIGIVHLLLNGWALLQLGGLFEAWLGSAQLAVVYLASGVCGSLASLFFMRGDLSAGASGAIFGLLGALIGFLLRRRDRLRPEAKQLLAQLVAWAAINVVFGLTTPGIDNAGHLGGAAAGFVQGLRLRPRWERRAPQPSDTMEA